MEQRRNRVAGEPSRKLRRVLRFLKKEVWSQVPPKFLGRRVTKKEREEILGYGKRGV